VEKNLVPIINAKRLCLKTLSEISKETVNRRMTIRYGGYDSESMTLEHIRERQANLDAILGRKVTSVCIQEEKKEQVHAQGGEDSISGSDN
jgi:hypothetical protein